MVQQLFTFFLSSSSEENVTCLFGVAIDVIYSRHSVVSSTSPLIVNYIAYPMALHSISFFKKLIEI